MTDQIAVELAHRLEVAVESNEKYRSRARAISTLCAAAAGALAAGLTIAPMDGIPKLAHILGLIAITLLIAATGLGLAAGSASSYLASEKRLPDLWHTIEVWKIRTKAPQETNDQTTYVGLIQDAAIIKNGISRIISAGLWCGFFAALALIASLSTALFYEESSREVLIELRELPIIVNCPDLAIAFKGNVQDKDLHSDLAILPVTVSANECGNSDGALLFVEKPSITIVR